MMTMMLMMMETADVCLDDLGRDSVENVDAIHDAACLELDGLDGVDAHVADGAVVDG